jgi:DNA-binding SARP family transcriptional activator/tetratricopeptide (TPR) repeat protein
MLRVSLFGGVAVELDGETLDPPRSRRAWSLLAWLALHPGLHSRAEVAGLFWPDVLDRSARGNLRTLLWTLRSALTPGAEHLLVVEHDQLGLDAEADLWVDARAFATLCASDELEAAVRLCSGELLAGLDEEWALLAREEHRERLGAVMAALSRRASDTGDARAALSWARRRASLSPFVEEPHRDLMAQLAADGDVAAALGVYGRLSERLRRELRVAPSRATRELAEQLRAEGRAAPGPARPEQAAAPRQARLPALVGREHELRILLEALGRAREGRGGVVLVSGEAGLGKTRLASELLDRAASQGARVASGAGLELGGPAPLSLWAELLRDLRDRGFVLAADARTPAELARVAPELGLAPAAGSPALAPALQRTRMYEAIVDLVERASADAPLVVLLEDLHLADSPSVELAGYVGRRLSTLRVLLVLTRRELPRRPDVDAVALGLRARGALVHELALGPLEPAAIQRLVRSVAPLDETDLRRVVRAAEGNPLLAVESARALATGERGVPATLRAAVRATSRGVPATAWRLAELAAVAGRDLERREIARLLPDEWLDAAAGAIGAGLLVDRRGRLGFRHALLRQASYDDLPEPRRAWLHERIAEVLGPERAAESARHLRLAGRDELAVEHLARAAASARAVAALEEAEGYLREALEIVPRDAPLSLELAEVHAWRGRQQEAATTLQRALGLIRADDGAARADAHLRAGNWLRGAVCDPRSALTQYRAALEELDRGGRPERARRARALAGLAWCTAVVGDTVEAARLIDQAGEIAGDAGDDELFAHDLSSARGLHLLRGGEFTRSVPPLLAAAELALRAECPDLAYTSWINAASAAAAATDFDQALAIAERALAVMHTNGLASLQRHLIAARAHILTRLGRHEEARATVEAQRRIADRLGDPDVTALAAHDFGLVALATGDPATAERELGHALAGTPTISRPLARLARAEALATLGRPADAEAELDATVREPIGAADLPAMLSARFARAQGLIAAARRDPVQARQRLLEAARAWERQARPAETGEAWVANIVDLGRPPVLGLVEPASELQRIHVELARLATVPG